MIRFLIGGVVVGWLVGHYVLPLVLGPPSHHHINLDRQPSRYGPSPEHDPKDDDTVVTPDPPDDEPVPVWRPKDHDKVPAATGNDPYAEFAQSVLRKRLKISGDSYGQFWTDCRAVGVEFRCLIDTGASDVTFARSDALRLGINTSKLNFDGLCSTANGTVRTAHTQIARLEVGPFTLSNVPVMVLDSSMDMPVLGMGFLRRYKLTVGNDTLTISE